MKWARRYRARLKAALRVLAGQPVGRIAVRDAEWNDQLLFQQDRPVLCLWLSVDKELLQSDYLGTVDRMMGEQASRNAIQCVRERINGRA